MNVVLSTIKSDHDSWLAIARHIALLIRGECISHAMSKMARVLMSIDIWIKDIAIECQDTLRNITGDNVLPPLVCLCHL